MGTTNGPLVVELLTRAHRLGFVLEYRPRAPKGERTIVCVAKPTRTTDELLAIEAEVERLAVSANAALGDGSELRAAVAHVSALSADAREALGPVVADVRRTLAKYGDVADAGREALQFVREAAGRSLERVDGILADVRALTAKVASGQGTLGALLADRETYDDIREMMKDLKRHPWKFIWKE